MTLDLRERVDLRAVRQSAANVTPPLAADPNGAILSGTPRPDLEVERDFGPFRADFLCREAGLGRLVLNGTRPERTGHRHPGRVLTCAAGLDAPVTDAHRKALDWQNGIAGSAFQVMGLEIEPWRIADGSPLPRLTIVSKPNGGSRRVAAASRRAGNGDLEALYREFWSRFLACARGRADGVRLPRAPSGRHDQTISLGSERAVMRVSCSLRDRRIAVSVVLRKPCAGAIFDALHAHRAAIDAALPEPARWERDLRMGTSNIALTRDRLDTADRALWPCHHDWLTTRMAAMHHAVRPRLAKVGDRLALAAENSEATE